MPQEQTVFKDDEGNQPEQPTQAGQDISTGEYLSQLVGEGKKFSDAEALARGKLESDKHISHLEEQIAEMREELSKRKSAAEIAEQLRNEQPLAPTKENTAPGMTSDEVAKIVQDTMTAQEQSRTRTENVLEADKMFKAVHGDNAKDAIAAKAAELGMSLEALQNIAAQSPTAFAKMVDIDGDRKSNVSRDQAPMQGSADNERLNLHNPSVGEPKQGSKAWWTKRRHELGDKFWNVDVQQQLIKDKEEGRYDT